MIYLNIAKIWRMVAAMVVGLTALGVCSCGEKKHFTIKGTVEGIGAQVVSITYYADGGIKRESRAATDGQFALRGDSKVETLCLLETSSGMEIATLVVKNGDEITIKGQLGNPESLKVSGNGASEKIGRWTAENARLLSERNSAAINAAVAKFVRANRSDRAATALLVTRFYTPGYELLADSLLTGIDPEMRTQELLQGFNLLLGAQLTKHQSGEVRSMTLYVREDTTVSYSPMESSYSVIAFRPETSTATDSMTKALRELSERYPTKRLKVVEVSMARDSARWKQATARDSATWVQAWAPGSAASTDFQRLAIPALPYFVVADSSGTQVWRGGSVKLMKKDVEQRLRR